MSLASGAPTPHARKFIKPVDTSCQVSPQLSISDNAEPDDLTLKEVSVPVKTLGLGTGVLPGDVVQLQKEVGKALGCLLVTRTSLNAHHRKQVSDFKMALCQNESETNEAIKEAKALCTCTTREAEAYQVMLTNKREVWYAACIKEAKANCVSIIAKVENWCSMVIRKADTHGTTPFNSHMPKACNVLRWKP